MATKTVLGDLELPLAQCIDVEDRRALVRHALPGLDGDVLQEMGRRAARVAVTGVVAGDDARAELEKLRDRSRSAEPLDFVSDVATATRVTRVVVERWDVRELGGRPDRWQYALLLREHLDPPAPAPTTPPAPAPAPAGPAPAPATDTGTLVVEVTVEGDPGFDMSKVTVTAQSGATVRTLTDRTGSTWTDAATPAGDYVVRATVVEPALAGQATAAVQAGQTKQVQITLAPTAAVARAFMVSFRFNSAFVEPCMRAALRRAAAFARDHASQKVVVVGHTDHVDVPAYNQSLSERRARTVFAATNFGNGQAAADAAVAEWTAIRQRRTLRDHTEKDGWGVREYQQMLQELRFYPGEIDGRHEGQTNEAVRAFRCRHGLPPGTTVDDAVWAALIRDYLADDPPTIPSAQHLPNCPDSLLEWLGCGEDDPVDNVVQAHRQDRRVELLFTTDAALPCQVPVPDTWGLPAPASGVVPPWCLGPGSTSSRCCFSTRTPPPAPPRWLIQDAEPATFTVRGTLRREVEDPATGALSEAPAGNLSFVLVTPKGEFLGGEGPSGEAVPARTNAAGEFSFPGKPAGVYALEIRSPVLARRADQPDAPARGPTVCKALLSDGDTFDVLILRDPPLREIRLPVIVHLMRALHPTTREVRTCPDPLTPAVVRTQRTARDEAAVRALFRAANRIWGRARVTFEIGSVIDEAFATPAITQCGVGSAELSEIIVDSATSNVVNVYFFGLLEAAGEAGVHQTDTVLDPAGTVLRTAEGNALGDRVLATLFTGSPPTALEPTQDESEVILAHELGHHLGLPDLTGSGAALANRLMLQQGAGTNRRLVQTEAASARGSRNARDCQPLRLEVTGAVRFGGPLGHRFAAIHDAAAAPVQVQAVLPPHLLNAPGSTLTLTGGTPGATGTDVTVSRGAVVRQEVVARYTPAGSGAVPLETHVVVHVLDFDLPVDGAARLGGAAGTAFLALRGAGSVFPRADLFPVVFVVPSDLAAWDGGTEAADPLRRSVLRTAPSPTVVRATVAGVTREASITFVRATFGTAPLIGRGLTADVPLTLDPSPLPAGGSVTLRMATTAGTGEARFATNTATRTVTASGPVTIRGITESSVAGNIRLTAEVTGIPDPVVETTLTVVAAAIGAIPELQVGREVDVQITVTPSPLPPGTSLTLEILTDPGTTGGAIFTSTGNATRTITGTDTVRLRGTAGSSADDNLRLVVKITGQAGVLAERRFTVIHRLNFFVAFEIWNLTTRAFERLPAGVPVQMVDDDFIGERVMATRPTGANGAIRFGLDSFGSEDEPDIFFRVRGSGHVASGHNLPASWETKGWFATDNTTPGKLEDFTGNGIGTAAAPIVYRVGYDFHARVTYQDESVVPFVDRPAPIGVPVSLFNGFDRVGRARCNATGEAHGVSFDVHGGDIILMKVQFEIEDPSIHLRRGTVNVDDFTLFAGRQRQPSMGTDAAPIARRLSTDDRNKAMYFLKCLRELTTFLFHMSGGGWPGFNSLEYTRSSISGVPFSWPVGTVHMPDTPSHSKPGFSHQWDRGTIIHETTHQVFWQELGFSSLDIAFEAVFGSLSLTHFENLLSNAEHALIEGFPEFMEAVFEATVDPRFFTVQVGTNASNLHPLGPPPANNEGERVEGAYANGMFALFYKHVVGVAGVAAGTVGESQNGDVTATTPFITNAAVQARFQSMVWEPLRDLRSRDKTTTEMIDRIRVRNPAQFPALRVELRRFNMAF